MAEIPTIAPQAAPQIQSPQGISDTVIQTSNAILGSQMNLVNTATGKASMEASMADRRGAMQIAENRQRQIAIDQGMRLLQADNAASKAVDAFTKNVKTEAQRTGQMPNMDMYSKQLDDIANQYSNGLSPESMLTLKQRLGSYQNQFRDQYNQIEESTLNNNLQASLQDTANEHMKLVNRVDRMSTSKDLDQATAQYADSLKLLGLGGTVLDRSVKDFHNQGLQQQISNNVNFLINGMDNAKPIVDPKTGKVWNENLFAATDVIGSAVHDGVINLADANKLLDNANARNNIYTEQYKKQHEGDIMVGQALNGTIDPANMPKAAETSFTKFAISTNMKPLTQQSAQELGQSINAWNTTNEGKAITSMPTSYKNAVTNFTNSNDPNRVAQGLELMQAVKDLDPTKFNNSFNTEEKDKFDFMYKNQQAGLSVSDSLAAYEKAKSNPDGYKDATASFAKAIPDMETFFKDKLNPAVAGILKIPNLLVSPDHIPSSIQDIIKTSYITNYALNHDDTLATNAAAGAVTKYAKVYNKTNGNGIEEKGIVFSTNDLAPDTSQQLAHALDTVVQNKTLNIAVINPKVGLFSEPSIRGLIPTQPLELVYKSAALALQQLSGSKTLTAEEEANKVNNVKWLANDIAGGVYTGNTVTYRAVDGTTGNAITYKKEDPMRKGLFIDTPLVAAVTNNSEDLRKEIAAQRPIPTAGNPRDLLNLPPTNPQSAFISVRKKGN